MDKDVYVGIDVSKTELVVAVRPSSESFTLAYHRAGLKQLVGRLGELKPKLVVVEATGGLQRQVVAALWTGGIAVAAVNPSWVRSYARGGGLLAKTDRIDARLLALFAQREQPVPRPPLDAETQALQELATRRDQLLEMRVAEQQRLKRSSAQVRKELRQHIAYLEGRITQIDDDIDKTVRGAARARCCAAFRGWARCSAPRCCPSCRNWARSAAKPPPPWSESLRSPMTAAPGAAAGSSGADAIRSAASFTCAR
jgi:transposase